MLANSTHLWYLPGVYHAKRKLVHFEVEQSSNSKVSGVKIRLSVGQTTQLSVLVGNNSLH